ncbi:MAG: Gfo/Idh/MocA family oxidoreductase [Saprospiraceae bacterium]|nr:Gfo/Idh/MocA family oxidoreductase [Saprospiraceae bacterium]
MIRWGVMGLGKIAHTFAGEFYHITGGKIVFAASRENAKAEAFARQHHINHWGSYAACLEHREVDVVYISTPHHLHFELAKQALLYGKHVLCEKPITVFPWQLAELMTLAAEKKLFLMDAMWTYFLPAIKKAMHWCMEGKIGQVRHVSAEFAFPAVYNPDSRLF